MALFNFNPASIAADINFGLGLLSSFGANVDIVGIYDGGGNAVGQQLFQSARPVKAGVRESSKVMEHPGETGIMLQDHHIINPVEIELSAIINSADYSSTYSQLRQAFTNATQLMVKTRTGVYRNMIIVDMPHEEDPEMYDAIVIGIRMRQILYFTPGSNQLEANYDPIDAANSNTISSGLQQAAALGTNLLTSAQSIASYVNLVGRL